MEGVAQKESLELFTKTLKKLNPKAKLYLSDAEKQYSGVKLMNLDETVAELRATKQHFLDFAAQLNKMKTPLRFAILSLLSNSKVNVFNKGLVEFMRNVNLGGWNIRDDDANYAAFIIDHINYFQELNFKDESADQLESLFKSLSTN